MDGVLSKYFEVFQTAVGQFRDQIVSFASSLNPNQKWVIWVQLLAGSMTVLWIIIQFAAWRRLNEDRLERFLEDKINTDREDLVRERRETLAQLDRVVIRRGFRRALLLAWANFVLAVSFVLRILSLDTIKGLSNHTGLLLQVGQDRRARKVYLDIASEKEKKMRLYEGVAANARLEAQNALIFAGRIAVREDRPASAVRAFRKVLQLKDDPDAHLMVAELLATRDPTEALHQINIALEMPDTIGKPQTKSDLYRCMAQIYLAQHARGSAKRALSDARAVDGPQRYYFGLGKTDEILGDLYAPKQYFRKAAITAYQASVENYRKVPDQKLVQSVERKIRKLQGETAPAPDDWWTRRLERRGQALLKRVEERRAQASRTGD